MGVGGFKPCGSTRISFAGFDRTPLFLVANTAKDNGAAVFSTVYFTLCNRDSASGSQGIFLLHDSFMGSYGRGARIRLAFSRRKGRCAIGHSFCRAGNGGRGNRFAGGTDLECRSRSKGLMRLGKPGRVNIGMADLLGLDTRRFDGVVLLPRKGFGRFLVSSDGGGRGVLGRVFKASFCSS